MDIFKYDPYIYTNASRKPGKGYSNRDIPLVMLPKGTLLFRAIHISDTGMNFFTDTLGISIKDNIDFMNTMKTGDTGFCLSSSQNMFAFPYPYVGFGLYDWETRKEAWKKYNAFIVYFLSKSCPFVHMISPSKDVRGTPKGNREGNSIVRCNLLRNPCFNPTEKLQDYLSYDNCIDPLFMKKTKTIGSISMAEQDSFGKFGKKINSSLMKYSTLLKQEGKHDILSTITKNLYIDDNNIVGIPEIALHIRNPDMVKPIVVRKHIISFEDAINELYKDIQSDILNAIPLAIITGRGNIDVRNRGFRILSSEDEPLIQKNNIEENLRKFVEIGREAGFGQGIGKIINDKRTGFYVLDQLVPIEYLRTVEERNQFIFKKYDGLKISNISGGKRSTQKRKSNTKAKTYKGGRTIILNPDISMATKSNQVINKITNDDNLLIENFPIIIPTAPEPVSEEALINIQKVFAGLGEIYATKKRSSVIMKD